MEISLMTHQLSPTDMQLLEQVLASAWQLETTCGPGFGEEDLPPALVITPEGGLWLDDEPEFLEEDLFLVSGYCQVVHLPLGVSIHEVQDWIRRHAWMFVAVCRGMDSNWNGQMQMLTGTLTREGLRALDELYDATEELVSSRGVGPSPLQS